MPDQAKLFGTDLRLLPNLERENDRFPGHDLFTQMAPRGKDLLPVAGVENLQQALLLRFITPKGALAQLGHPDYGSDLYKLIGELNTETNRNRAKIFVLQALAQEPRVEKVLSLTVTPSPKIREQIDIKASLKTIESETPLNLVFAFSLEGT